MINRPRDYKKPEPVPPTRHMRDAGHHWLQEIDFDGRPGDIVVLQWNPGAKKWSGSGLVGTGTFVNTEGWKYLRVCEMPQMHLPNDLMKVRGFHLLSDADNGFSPIDAICQFQFNGYQVSISTAGLSKGACQTPVCVFFNDDKENVAQDGFHTVQEALDWIIQNPINKE